jgi:putative membrane protein
MQRGEGGADSHLAERNFGGGVATASWSEMKEIKMKRVAYVMCCALLGSMPMVSAHSAKAQASDADKQFLAEASQGNYDEIQLGKLAAEKGTDPAVRAFGERMVTDHTRLGQNMKPFAEEWGLNPPQNLSPDAQKEYDKLQGLSGHDFDKEYISDMVSDHSKDLDAFNKEVKDTQDQKFKTAVMHGKSVVAAHKNMAYDLKKKL